MKSHHLIIVLLLVVGIGIYYYLELEKAANQEAQPIEVESQQSAVDTTPEIQHPITETPVITDESTSELPAETEPPLPALEESDDRIKEILAEIIGSDLVKQFFKATGLIHRFVVTIDALPKKEVPVKYRLLPPTAEKFLVKEYSVETFTLDPENFKRYDSTMQLLDKLDTELFVKWYKRFYPLIQEAYDSLGYQNRYFNDRFIVVIDHLLETPEATGSIQLVPYKIFYKFADPALQKLSAGQKILIRIGPVNAALVKAKLTEIRNRLAVPQQSE